MDRIQYTYKRYIYVFDMKSKTKNQTYWTCVCELEHINTSLSLHKI